MTTITTKQHDTKVTFMDTPTIDGVALSPASLVGCTVSFLMKGDALVTPIKQPAVINPDGTFSYEPTSVDVGTPGEFRQEWELVYPGGKALTFPNDGWNVVRIVGDLG